VSARVERLRAELRDDSAVVATPRPRLSWTVVTDETGWRQAAAEVRSGAEEVRLDGDGSVLVDWPFPPLAAGESRDVSVRVTAESGTTTDWSETLAVEPGFVGAWTAEPVGLAEPAREAQPALLRRSFTLDRPVRRARLFYSALGAAEVEVNGSPVDDGVLAPGWTSYKDRLIHETVDVTSRIRRGENVIGAWLAGAWFTEKYGFQGFAKRVYGDQPALLAQLEIEYADSDSLTIVTDESWLATGDGPVVDSGIYAGEHYDARRFPAGWSEPGFDAGAWTAVTVIDAVVPVPEARIAPPVRRTEELAVRESWRSPSGALLLDFGQNLVGRLRIRVSGPAGTEIALKHAEVLENGELALRPLRLAAATDTYVLAGKHEEVWEPRFTFHGFRYVQIDGWPGELDPAAVTAVVLSSDNTRTGWFSSSHELLDRLHENVVWGMRGNFLSLPTDCPQRDERLGWTGDVQVFSPTASFLYDVDGFLASWLRDLALEQAHTKGLVPLVVPSVLDAMETGAVAAWGDAATVVPWVVYQRFGDVGVLRDQYPSMRAWVDAVLGETDGDGLWADRMQLGDWLDPSAPPDKPQQAKVDADIVATAYLARSLRIVSDAAAVLGDRDDSVRYSELADRSRDAFVAEYVTANGRMMSDAPTAYALALELDLVTDPAVRQRLSDRLADLVRANGYRIGTGFVGTPLVTDALTGGGHLYAASRLLLQTENPSWLYPVTHGATTVWERWDSLLEDGSVNPGEMTSFNHYALGAVADWLHRVVAGLAPAEPGYRKLRIAPRPLPGLDHAEARHDTPYGPASVAWRREGDTAVVTAEVPPNTTAVVDLGGEPFEVGSGRHEWTMDAASDEPAFGGPFDLDSPLSSVMDEPRAYRALLDAVGKHDPDRLATLRRDPVWTRGQTVRFALLFAPPALSDEVEQALSGVTSRD